LDIIETHNYIACADLRISQSIAIGTQLQLDLQKQNMNRTNLLLIVLFLR